MLKTISSIVNAIGALNYKGTWNASTNTPTLASGVGTKGDYYVVSVAGSTNLDGETLWGVGDWAVFNGSIWQKVDGGSTGNFTSVNTGTLNVTGNTTLGDASTDTVTVNGYMGVGGAASTDSKLLIVGPAASGTNQYGLQVRASGTSGATGSVRAVYGRADTEAASFTTSAAVSFWSADAIKGAGSTITNQHGLYINDQTQGTNNYGITSLVSSGSNKWNIYASGTAANYFAGNVQFAAGTAAAPALTRFGDDNTGIFFPAADTIAFAEGGAEAMRLDASGNLGLGVTPSAWSGSKALEISVLGSAMTAFSANNTQFLSNAYFNGTNWIYANNGTANQYQLNGGSYVWGNAASGTAGGTITWTERMRLDSSGNLLIGSAASSIGGSSNLEMLTTKSGGVADLLVSNSSNTASSRARVWISNGGTSAGSANLLFTSGLAGTRLVMGVDSTDGDKFKIGNGYNVGAGTTYLTLDASGNLGIGTASPVNKLQVVGSFGRGAPVTKTGNFTLAATENWIICNGTGTITVTLPAASSWTGREFTIKTIAAFTVISNASNVVPLAGGAAGTAILAATAGTWATLVSDGTNWIIMQA